MQVMFSIKTKSHSNNMPTGEIYNGRRTNTSIRFRLHGLLDHIEDKKSKQHKSDDPDKCAYRPTQDQIYSFVMCSSVDKANTKHERQDVPQAIHGQK